MGGRKAFAGEFTGLLTGSSSGRFLAVPCTPLQVSNADNATAEPAASTVAGDSDEDDEVPIVEDVTQQTHLLRIAAAIAAADMASTPTADGGDPPAMPIAGDGSDHVPAQQAACFQCGERVLCSLPDGWFRGTVIMLTQSDFPDGSPPLSNLVHIRLENALVEGHQKIYVQDKYVRREVCFGQLVETESYIEALVKQLQGVKQLRFAVGERVACLVEDDSGDNAVWKGGTVSQLRPRLSSSLSCPVGQGNGTNKFAAYTVQLDSDCRVFVPKDHHLLVRDLRCQPVGVHDAGAFGKRFSRQLRSDDSGQWDLIDLETRRKRACSPPPRPPPPPEERA